MSFNEETMKAKLSSLSETQDSIVTVAQWIMFYRRFADSAAQIWLAKIKESNYTKRLVLIYLANEIMQQARSRKKEDFLHAFTPVMADATSIAYKGATQEVQQKIRRVVEVWRERRVLDDGVQSAVEARLNEVDKSKSTKTGNRLGGALFDSSSVPAELQPLTKGHAAISKAETTSRGLLTKANAEFAEQTSPAAAQLSPPVQAGKLSALLKSLASAESAVNDSIKARNDLIQGLEAVLKVHRSKLEEEEKSAQDLSERRGSVEKRRKEVEDSILGRISAEESNGYGSSAMDSGNNGSVTAMEGGPSRSPDVEGFTPPPPEVESFTPTASPTLAPQPEAEAAGLAEDPLEYDSYAADTVQEQPPRHDEPPPLHMPPTILESHSSNGAASSPGADLLASLSLPGMRSSSAVNDESKDPRKRRKTSHKSGDFDDQFFATGDGVGLDADVAANLGAQ